jgi:hypothetical protein
VHLVLSQPVIRLNQLGFRPDDRKGAVVLSESGLSAGDFSVINATTGRVAIQLDAAKLPTTHGVFQDCRILDFSRFRSEGRFVVEMAGARSDTFTISHDVYRNVLSYPLQYLLEQRCGRNPVFNMPCHQEDGIIVDGPNNGKSIDAVGGYHDASDYLRFLITTSYVAGNLLITFKEFPELWDDMLDSNGAKSPNGIPDILDEARWGIEWMLKLNPGEGELYHQVADDRDHSFWDLPFRDDTDYGWGKGRARPVYAATGASQGIYEHKNSSTGIANIAGRTAAVFALGAVIWSERFNDKDFVATLSRKSAELYRAAKKFSGVSESVPCKAPYRYHEKTFYDDLEWAAAELYRLTKDKAYLEEAISFSALAADTSWMDKDTTLHYEYFPYVNLGHYELFQLADEQTKQKLASYYQRGLREVRKRGMANPFGYGIPFIWCSNNLAAACVTQALLYEKMTGSKEFNDLLFSTRDWLFGRNPWGRSFIVGIPESGGFPTDPHSVVGKELNMRLTGALVDGPVYASIFSALRGLRLNEPDELERYQSDFVVYHDDVGDYSTNEPTLDGTESLLFILAWFAGR